MLQEFHEGIIALSACLAGEVPRFILKGMKDEARKAARKYEPASARAIIFWNCRIMSPEQQTVNMALLQMSRELDIPLVCTNDVHYTYAEDAKPHDILLSYPDRQKAFRRKPDALRGRSVFRQKRRRDEGTRFPMRGRTVEITQP